MKIPFWKVEAVGNDFVLVQLNDFTDPDAQLPSLARRVSRRHFSIGSDGVLAIARQGKTLRLRMFNPDGSEDFCGNGLRCAAAYADIHGWLDGPETVIEHLGHLVPAAVTTTDSPRSRRVRTTIGSASFQPEDVPMAPGSPELFEGDMTIGGESLKVSSLTTGSTHSILFVDELPGGDRFERLSAMLEHAPLFPERTSVIWAIPQPDGSLRIRIFERGAGETMGCGTGSSAAAAAWFRKSGGGGSIRVVNPGGTVLVEMDAWNSPISIESEAEEVYSGTLDG